MTDILQHRMDYQTGSLDESALLSSPDAQLGAWLEQAVSAGVREPHAMGLSTVNPDGRPSSRIVLLRGLDSRGLAFFTRYDSRKGTEITANPFGCLLFFWAELERQVRVEGKIVRLDDAESDAYYASRPLGSKIGAWASPQSAVIPSREWLEHRVREASEAQGDSPSRPAEWGGFRLVPDAFEFWQGRPSRLHDRLRMNRAETGWTVERLAP